MLSNSEQRFLHYKSIASRGENFNRIIEKGTAIVDIGGGSIQVSLFDKDSLVATQNMKLGVLRLREQLHHLNVKPVKEEELISEIVNAQLSVFKKLYLKDRQIQNIIVVDDYLSAWVKKKSVEGEDSFSVADVAAYEALMKMLRTKSKAQMASVLGMPDEKAQLLFISAVLMKCAIKVMQAEMIWAPGVTLCDGIAYDYAQKNRMITSCHDFEQDIIACARNISKRYMGSKRRGDTLEAITLIIYDSMRKIHGLSKRERLLLRIAAFLHDCGKYISMVDLAECSYQIIMATEIIGLSHKEREIIANVVKFNHSEFVYYHELQSKSIDRQAYLVMAKLTAILRVANGLDRSHKEKFTDIRAAVKDNTLTITVDTQEDITLEKGLFDNRAAFFEEVFSVRPVIKQKRSF